MTLQSPVTRFSLRWSCNIGRPLQSRPGWPVTSRTTPGVFGTTSESGWRAIEPFQIHIDVFDEKQGARRFKWSVDLWFFGARSSRLRLGMFLQNKDEHRKYGQGLTQERLEYRKWDPTQRQRPHTAQVGLEKIVNVRAQKMWARSHLQILKSLYQGCHAAMLRNYFC